MIRITTASDHVGADALVGRGTSLARGDASSVIFFGSFLLLAGAGTLAMDSGRSRIPTGRASKAVTSNIPFVAIAQGRNRIRLGEIGWLRRSSARAPSPRFLRRTSGSSACDRSRTVLHKWNDDAPPVINLPQDGRTLRPAQASARESGNDRCRDRNWRP
jgi:hypothetical protein